MLRYADYPEERFYSACFNCGKSCVFFLLSINIQWPLMFKITFGCQNCPICVQYLKEQIS